MFVQTNTIQAVKAYFKNRLNSQFTESELNFMLKEAIIQRLKISRADYLLCDQEFLSESDLLYFRSIVKRLMDQEPFQYIIGVTEFYGLELITDSRALIPRPETEELVQWITQQYNGSDSLQIADICTGSGCIALALKLQFKNASVLATDFSQSAVDLANENAKLVGLEIETILLDATTNNPIPGKKENLFDCWVSNPPYIPISDQLEMADNVLKFEPHMALFVENNDPLIFYRKISENAHLYLKSGGKLFFEIHERFATETIAVLENFGFVNIQLRKDLQGRDRMLQGQKP